MKEDVTVLKGIGLTLYESKSYVTLTSLISATATEIAEKSDIPRSKIYDVLNGLSEKNFIEVEDGRPQIYRVKSPVDVLALSMISNSCDMIFSTPYILHIGA